MRGLARKGKNLPKGMRSIRVTARQTEDCGHGRPQHVAGASARGDDPWLIGTG